MSRHSCKVEFSEAMASVTQETYSRNSDFFRSLVKLEDYCNRNLAGLSLDFDIMPSDSDATQPAQVLIHYRGVNGGEPVSGRITAYCKNGSEDVPVLSFAGGGEIALADDARQESLGFLLSQIVQKEACNNVYKQIKAQYD